MAEGQLLSGTLQEDLGAPVDEVSAVVQAGVVGGRLADRAAFLVCQQGFALPPGLTGPMAPSVAAPYAGCALWKALTDATVCGP